MQDWKDGSPLCAVGLFSRKIQKLTNRCLKKVVEDPLILWSLINVTFRAVTSADRFVGAVTLICTIWGDSHSFSKNAWG